MYWKRLLRIIVAVCFAALWTNAVWCQSSVDIYAIGFCNGKPALWEKGVMRLMERKGTDFYRSIVEAWGNIYIAGKSDGHPVIWDINGKKQFDCESYRPFSRSSYMCGQAVAYNNKIYIPGTMYYGATDQREESQATVWENGLIAILGHHKVDRFSTGGTYCDAMSVAGSDGNIYVAGIKRYGKNLDADGEVIVWLNGGLLYNVPINTYGTGVGNTACVGVYHNDVYVAGTYYGCSGFQPLLIKNGIQVDASNRGIYGFVALAVADDKMLAIGNSNNLREIITYDSYGVVSSFPNVSPVIASHAYSAFVRNGKDIYVGGYVTLNDKTQRAAIWKNGKLFWLSVDPNTQINSFIIK